MKRTILSLTTAIALAAPAAAQTGVEETVMDVLAQNGYPAGSIEMLSQGQVAELYLTATSDDPGDVAEVIASFDLPSDEASDVFVPSTDPTGVESTVSDVLVEYGYSADTVNALSGGDIANIYTAATSESASDVEEAISSAIDANVVMMSDDPSAAEERAINYLYRRGYTPEQVGALDQAELLSIYTALTSGDQNDINDAVDSALQS